MWEDFYSLSCQYSRECTGFRSVAPPSWLRKRRKNLWNLHIRSRWSWSPGTIQIIPQRILNDLTAWLCNQIFFKKFSTWYMYTSRVMLPVSYSRELVAENNHHVGSRNEMKISTQFITNVEALFLWSSLCNILCTQLHVKKSVRCLGMRPIKKICHLTLARFFLWCIWG